MLGRSLIEYIDIVMTEQGRKLAHQIQVFSLFNTNATEAENRLVNLFKVALTV